MNIDWTKSMSQSFEYYYVDPATWKDVKLIKTVKSSSIDRDLTADTLGSATIDLDEIIGECYIRIYLVINQNEVKDRIPLGTYLIQTPQVSYDGKVHSVSADAYTPLLELKEKKVPLGYFIPKDSNIMDQAYNVIKDKCRCPVVKTINDKTLSYNFISNYDDTYDVYIKDLISLANYSFGLDELGRIIFMPYQDLSSLKPIWTFTSDNSSILFPEISLKHDYYGIPNVVEVIYNDSRGVMKAVAKNEDPGSPISIINRGREIVYSNEKIPAGELPTYPTQEMLDLYAKKLLQNLSNVEYKISFSHGYCPVKLGDCVRIDYPKMGLNGVKAKIISQKIKCTTGCSVTTTAVLNKSLWN